MMALVVPLFVFSSVLHLLLLISPAHSTCPKSFSCGNLRDPLEFPLTNLINPKCGIFMVNCTSLIPTLQLGAGGDSFEILHKVSTNRLFIRDPNRRYDSDSSICISSRNYSLPESSPSASLTMSPNMTLFVCFNESYNERIHEQFESYYSRNCQLFSVFYRHPSNATVSSVVPPRCLKVQLPVTTSDQNSSDLFNLLTAEFEIEWNVSDDCNRCHHRGGQCTSNNMNKFLCKRSERSRKTLILLSTVLSGGSLLVLCLAVSFILWRRKKKMDGAYVLSRSLSSNPSSKSQIEGGSFCYGIPIFCYTELEEATGNFDPSKELGDGGFGTVYYGKLRDGREVAIKRLYEHNYKRVQQFMNEIKILTCLKHPNLVTLYGCTSRRSRELLLVYEYIPNGTVADHLHGKRVKEAPVAWDIRMNIAIETASALAYLHKSDTVHRDVKTNNILLDSNFCVKVADFGLSRLFPNNVTHISTAPQGTPGYVDPEYHQCYQLTDKSDVYSFGVVLIELISSMPAIDISRHRHEINLANLAVNRIQRCAFDELIDSSLGYKSDTEVTRMTTSVAELAFRCLQLEKDMRPSMDEVFEILREIQNGGEFKHENRECKNNGKIPHSPETDDAVLLKKKNFQSSPTAVTEVWVSGSSTTTDSIG